MEKEKQKGKKMHLRLVEKYENDDYSRHAAPDYSDSPFELGEEMFVHSPHTDQHNIHFREKGSWEHPGISGKSDDEEDWVNSKEYDEETDSTGHGAKNYKRSDERIHEDVCELLMKNPSVDARHIGVSVNDGIVYLAGKVSSRHMKKVAERIAEDVAGVQDVKNELQVRGRDEDPKGPDTATRNDLGLI